MKKNYVTPEGYLNEFSCENIMSVSSEYVDKGTQNYSINWEALPYDDIGY